MDLDTIIWAEYTLLDLLEYAGIGIAIIFIIVLIKKFFFTKKKTMEHSYIYKCPNCGWQGNIGNFARACPKCSNPIQK